MSVTRSKAFPHVFFQWCGTIIPILLSVQCSWTPEITTLIHEGEEGIITLETSSKFKTPPSHPYVIQESFIKKILQGLTYTQETGLLQEIFIAESKPSPAFSSAQINFLTLHLVNALSKATQEELITFRHRGTKPEVTHLNGTVAVFSPGIFIFSIQNLGGFSGNHSKMASSSRNLQRRTTLIFSPKEAVLNPKEAQRFMKMSAEFPWIAINSAALIPDHGNSGEGNKSPPPLFHTPN